eukprot:UN34055
MGEVDFSGYSYTSYTDLDYDDDDNVYADEEYVSHGMAISGCALFFSGLVTLLFYPEYYKEVNQAHKDIDQMMQDNAFPEDNMNCQSWFGIFFIFAGTVLHVASLGTDAITNECKWNRTNWSQYSYSYDEAYWAATGDHKTNGRV